MPFHMDLDDPFASPAKVADLPQVSTNTRHAANSTAPVVGESRFDTDEAREAALRKELQGVRRINEVMEGVERCFDLSTVNMETMTRAVVSSLTLLNTWTRILAQTEHNQRLILNPSWQGASQDIADIENESVLKQQAAERRELEAQQRRTAAAKKAEDDERRRNEISLNRGRSVRGRGSGRSRGIPPPSVYASAGSQYRGAGGGRGGLLPRRGTSGIGRGESSGRGRGVR
ncbi:MAG: hypothetical protein M1829_003237 [Trizodia sp. TS-e1964]|nr:MAG: hypothetical protein M1829_003237 [Trizodia sp. TS-e1964]